MAWQGPGCPGKTAEYIRRFAGQPGILHEVKICLFARPSECEHEYTFTSYQMALCPPEY